MKCLIVSIPDLGPLSYFAEHFIDFPNEFNKFNKTGARMSDYVHHMTLKLHSNSSFGVKTFKFCQLVRNVIMDVTTLHY